MANRNYFAQFNKEFLFELPDEIKGNYLKIDQAAEKYAEGTVIDVIAYGISTNHSPKAVSERNAWVATAEEFINVPSFQLPEVEKMMQDPNAVKLCKEGHLGIVIEGYENQWGSQYKIKWTDR